MYCQSTFHFLDVIVPAYEHYVSLSKQNDHPKALFYNTATSVAQLLYDFTEVLRIDLKGKELRRDVLVKDCSDYDWIADIRHSLNHTEVSRKGRIIKDRQAIELTLVNSHFPRKENKTPKSYFGVMEYRIMITPITGRGNIRDLLEICTNVINFWAKFIKYKGLIDRQLSFEYEGDKVIEDDENDPKNNSPLPKPMADGITRMTTIARYYDAEDNKFYRWGFGENFSLISVKVDERAPNAKAVLTLNL